MDWVKAAEEAAKEWGLWAVVFIGFLIFVMRQAAVREDRLMNFLAALESGLEKMADKYEDLCNLVSNIQQDIHDMKERGSRSATRRSG